MKKKLCTLFTVMIFVFSTSLPLKSSADTSTQSTPSNVAHNITVDGQTSDWTGLSPVATGDKSNKKLYAYIDKNSLSLLVTGENLDSKDSDFYVDIDTNVSTGYHPSVWSDGGAEFLVENSTLYKYSGSAYNWNWVPLCDIDVKKTSTTIEVKVLVSQMELKSFRQNINVSYALWYDKEFLPREDQPMTPCTFDYVWTPLDDVIDTFVTRYSTVFGK